ncbi:MAG: bifunctional (p)ppGpp synthetase/guanosine-3',5'-bis(diphosphate) 3'-pyrophosphohydrolase [Clostridiales bacterium]|nr:bifunctional (p)ppGpp synthetase/guanosine-3',5'-bis(diphosphate) 3'-pyrophosphohydrolase [Clostridiales bacterium]
MSKELNGTGNELPKDKTPDEMFEELIKEIEKYNPAKNHDIVRRAYKFAEKAHSNVFRQDGTPYITHPLKVAIILAELAMDDETLAAALLHDIVEDTPYTHENLSHEFSEKIALLVEGVTKLTKLQYVSFADRIAETYRKMIIYSLQDNRVIIIKVADRLHNMRTLNAMSADKQARIAKETMSIYCPIARRLGLGKIFYELEDLAFKYAMPIDYQEIKQRVAMKLSLRRELIDGVVSQVKERLVKENINFDSKNGVTGRGKHFYSIYKKIALKNTAVEDMYDLNAIRVIVDSIADCYTVFGLLHEMYTPIPGRVKDYIAVPKENHYQSLHDTLYSAKNGYTFEVQIRTRQMHLEAEYGVAAHWKYKADFTGKTSPYDGKLDWLRQLFEIHTNITDNEEFMAAIKSDLNDFSEEIYCFTPKGQPISLKKGSTVVDFAYKIHSEIGNKMNGAKVKGVMVPLNHVLKHGDAVEILTSTNAKGPTMEWLKFAHETQARLKIRQWFNKQNKKEHITKGIQLIESKIKALDYSASDILTEKYKEKTFKRYNVNNWDTLCALVGRSCVSEGQVINYLLEQFNADHPKTKTEQELLTEIVSAPAKSQRNKKASISGVIVDGAGDVAPHFSKCCTPVPGDDIVAFVRRGKTASIHRSDCLNMKHLSAADNNRIVKAHWDLPENARILYSAELRIVSSDRPNLLLDFHKVFSAEKVIINSIATKKSHNEVVTDLITSVTNREYLEYLITILYNINGVKEIERIKL